MIKTVISALQRVITGKEQQLKLALCTLISQGHLLIEDLPGMGKTTLSQALARVTGLNHRRIQFTSDLLPADILGISVFNQQDAQFTFHPGPVFSNIIVADEINRATPKTQSALLEAMEEGQVTVEGETRQLPQPFFVIATQNPTSQGGTFALPESQLDRFFMRLSMGYPHPEDERALLLGEAGRVKLETLQQVISTEQLTSLQEQVNTVHTSPALLDYLQRLVAGTRDNNRFAYGLSPRGALTLLKASRAWALMAERDYVMPEDIQSVFSAVCGHRIYSASSDSTNTTAISRLLDEVDVIASP